MTALHAIVAKATLLFTIDEINAGSIVRPSLGQSPYRAGFASDHKCGRPTDPVATVRQKKADGYGTRIGSLIGSHSIPTPLAANVSWGFCEKVSGLIFEGWRSVFGDDEIADVNGSMGIALMRRQTSGDVGKTSLNDPLCKPDVKGVRLAPPGKRNEAGELHLHRSNDPLRLCPRAFQKTDVRCDWSILEVFGM